MDSLRPDSASAIKEIRNIARSNEKIVFVSGNFNIIHPGHLRLLRFAAECGDFLVVGVNDNTSKGAMLPEALRLEGIQSTSWVDFAFILRDDPGKFIQALRPAVVVKGKEFEDQFNQEAEVVASYGGSLLFSSGDVTFSSLDLLKDEISRLNFSTIAKPTEFLKRHSIDIQDLMAAMEAIKTLRTIVVGDVIVDEYITCDPVGMSQEDPTIVLTPVYKEQFIGGAGIVASHARGLGAFVQYHSVVGADQTAEFAKRKLHEYGVETKIYTDYSRPTTRKQRFRANDKTLLKVNHLRQHGITTDLQQKILNDITSSIASTDLVIFSDFNYGCLPQQLVDAIREVCIQHNTMMVADSQSSSQIGDISRFKNMALITPTETEARIALHDYNSGLVVLAEKLRKKSQASNVYLTLGSEGVLVHAELSESNRWLTDRLAALNTAPKDIAGAGDSMLASSALLMAAGGDVWQGVLVGSITAACQVGRVGNTPVSSADLLEEIRGL